MGPAVDLPDPYGYGRIIRDGSGVIKIVEERTRRRTSVRSKEVNTGILAIKGKHLKSWLGAWRTIMPSANTTTDVIAMAVNDDVRGNRSTARSDEVLRSTTASNWLTWNVCFSENSPKTSCGTVLPCATLRALI